MDFQISSPHTHNSAIGCSGNIRLDIIHRSNPKNEKIKKLKIVKNSQISYSGEFIEILVDDPDWF